MRWNKNLIFNKFESLYKELGPFLHKMHFKNEFSLFIDKWKNIHVKIINFIQIDEQHKPLSDIDLKTATASFMKKRQGLVSCFAQILKSTPNAKEDFVTLGLFLKTHDQAFQMLLNMTLDNYNDELFRLQSLKKATQAYLHSHFSPGG